MFFLGFEITKLKTYREFVRIVAIATTPVRSQMVFTLQGARRSGHYGGMEYLAILFLFITFASGVSAFGAGTTSTGETRWRHGDVEKALLGLTLARSAGGLTFTKIDVKRVYFGNWLRDYSQIMDVGSLKVVGPNVLRTLVWKASPLRFLCFLFLFLALSTGNGHMHLDHDLTDSNRTLGHLIFVHDIWVCDWRV